MKNGMVLIIKDKQGPGEVKNSFWGHAFRLPLGDSRKKTSNKPILFYFSTSMHLLKYNAISIQCARRSLKSCEGVQTWQVTT